MPVGVYERPPLEERFWAKVEKTEGGCWLWTAAMYPNGYGAFGVDGRTRLVHRLAYELVIGPIPEGLDLDHLCHNEDEDCQGGDDCVHRRCVNPDHLEPATRRLNLLRGATIPAKNAAKTHCPHGHPFDEANTHRTQDGSRQCRACIRARSQRWRDQQKEMAA